MALPSGYTKLEYIESTGTQWIDTKVYPSESRILIDAYVLESNTGNDHHIASASWAETGKSEFFNVMRLRADRTGFAARYGNGNLRNVEHQGNVYGRHIFDRKFVATPFTVQVDEATALTLTPSIAGSISCYLPLFAFRRNNGSCSGFISMRLYSCKIWKTITYEGTPLVRDFIPCKNASGEVGLWDDVNSVFYGNAGTGTFIAGELPALTAHKTLVNGTVYEVKGGKCLVNGTVYSIKKGRTLIGGTGYDITFAPSYDPVFANNTWEQIITACHSNEVPDTWKVADYKPMTINGVGYQIDIIGKNHDTYTSGGKAPLTFQLHDCYGELKNMNNSDTNSGGWTSCAMRSKHLPDILSRMPTEVQNGIREVNKLTSAGNLNAAINTTADKLFPLSEIEIFGSVSLSRSGEGTQYDYYKAGRGRVKYLRGDTVNWWGRSPTAANYAAFCYANIYGSSSVGYATSGAGVSFGFCF